MARPHGSVRRDGHGRVGEFEWDDAKAGANIRKHGVVNGHQEMTHLGHEELTHPGVAGRVALTQ
jgi:hypothetical protein